MANNKLRIVFMGTPEFGVPSLRMLVESGYDVAGVITQPDRPRGRGHKVTPSPVKRAAVELGVPVFSEAKISSPEGVGLLHLLKPDLLVTAAFGQILSEEVLQSAPLGCINVHASLLPSCRGASPIAGAIMRGDRVTGITTMRTVRELDAGPILEQDSLDISPQDTAGSLTEKLSTLGASTLKRTLEKLAAGTLVDSPQNDAAATYCPSLPKGYGEIDWNRDAESICRFVRALAPAPLAYIRVGDEKIRVVAAESLGGPRGEYEPGTITAADPKAGLRIAAQDGIVSVLVLRRPGAKQMTAKESLRGRPLPVGARITRLEE